MAIDRDHECVYQKGFDILMEFWDSIPDEYKEETHEKLQRLGI